MGDLKVGAGYSAERDTEAAVREAVLAARKTLGGVEPGLVMLAATVDHDAALVDQAVRRELPNARVHGATSSLGVLGQNGVVMGAGGGVGVMLFGSEGDGVHFAVGSSTLEDGAHEGGRRAAEILARRGPEGQKPRVLFVAATPGDEEEVLAGIGEVLPGVPIFGGSAADHAIEGAWSVFTTQGAVKMAVSLAGIYGDVKIGSAFDGPYEPTEKRETVTQAKGRSIATLGGRPAAQVLHEWIGDGIAEQVRDGGNLLLQTALSPVGIAHKNAKGDSYYLLLHPAHAHAAGGVDLFARAPEGATLCLMRGSEESLIGIMDRLVDEALASSGMTPADARGAFLIYCAGCAGAVGSRINDVMSRLKSRLGDIPVLGFCTFGEQGFVPGVGNIHSNLSVALVLAG
jgi:hypothetical protein